MHWMANGMTFRPGQEMSRISRWGMVNRDRREVGGRRREVCHLLNSYVPRTNDASTRVKVVPTRDKPLEQCAAANVLHLLRTAAARWCDVTVSHRAICSNVTAFQPLPRGTGGSFDVARDRPLEQCSDALRTAAALHTACVSGGVLVNVLVGRVCSVRQHAH